MPRTPSTAGVEKGKGSSLLVGASATGHHHHSDGGGGWCTGWVRWACIAFAVVAIVATLVLAAVTLHIVREEGAGMQRLGAFLLGTRQHTARRGAMFTESAGRATTITCPAEPVFSVGVRRVTYEDEVSALFVDGDSAKSLVANTYTVWYPSRDEQGVRARYTPLYGGGGAAQAAADDVFEDAAPIDEARVPRLLLLPDFAEHPHAYAWLGEELARRGVVVVGVVPHGELLYTAAGGGAASDLSAVTHALAETLLRAHTARHVERHAEQQLGYLLSGDVFVWGAGAVGSAAAMQLAGTLQRPCADAAAALLDTVYAPLYDAGAAGAGDNPYAASGGGARAAAALAAAVCKRLPRDVDARRAHQFALEQLHGVVLAAPRAPAALGLVGDDGANLASYPALWLERPAFQAAASAAEELYEAVPREALSCGTGALLTEYGANASQAAFVDSNVCAALAAAVAEGPLAAADGWLRRAFEAAFCAPVGDGGSNGWAAAARLCGCGAAARETAGHVQRHHAAELARFVDVYSRRCGDDERQALAKVAAWRDAERVLRRAESKGVYPPPVGERTSCAAPNDE